MYIRHQNYKSQNFLFKVENPATWEVYVLQISILSLNQIACGRMDSNPKPMFGYF